MTRKLLPLLLGLLGLLIGAGAGYFFRPSHYAAPSTQGPAPNGTHGSGPEQPSKPDLQATEAVALKDYAKMANQFIIPVLVNGKVSALMVLSLSLEVSAGTTPDVDAAEPKLRDAFLQVLFDHANSGGFNGSYTDTANLVILRIALLEAAKSVLGDKVSDVLITDILRRDG